MCQTSSVIMGLSNLHLYMQLWGHTESDTTEVT